MTVTPGNAPSSRLYTSDEPERIGDACLIVGALSSDAHAGGAELRAARTSSATRTSAARRRARVESMPDRPSTLESVSVVDVTAHGKLPPSKH